MTYVPLEAPKKRITATGHRLQNGYWKKSKPFVDNDRAHLIHRPIRITEHVIMGKRHIAVEYLCQNRATGLDNFTFLDLPPPDKMVCAVCEARAVMAGLPSASELAGRHVHVGRMKPVMTCIHGTGEDAR